MNDKPTGKTVKRRLVLKISRMTTHNGPGLRSLVMFKGCPLRCMWCSTPESQKFQPEISLEIKRCIKCDRCITACPLNAISRMEDGISINRIVCNNCGECTRVCIPEAIKLLGQEMTVEEIVGEIEKDRVFYNHSGGGLTISGGEPLLQLGFTMELLKACAQGHISVGADTCGHVPWADVEQVLPYVDFFLWDIKHMDPEKHLELTGVSNDLILSNIQAVSDRGGTIYIRIPVIPGYNDSEENIRATCKFASSRLSVVEVDLLPVHHLGRARYENLGRSYPLDHVSLISDESMQDMKRLVESYGLRCCIGG